MRAPSPSCLIAPSGKTARLPAAHRRLAKGHDIHTSVLTAPRLQAWATMAPGVLWTSTQHVTYMVLRIALFSPSQHSMRVVSLLLCGRIIHQTLLRSVRRDGCLPSRHRTNAAPACVSAPAHTTRTRTQPHRDSRRRSRRRASHDTAHTLDASMISLCQRSQKRARRSYPGGEDRSSPLITLMGPQRPLRKRALTRLPTTVLDGTFFPET